MGAWCTGLLTRTLQANECSSTLTFSYIHWAPKERWLVWVCITFSGMLAQKSWLASVAHKLLLVHWGIATCSHIDDNMLLQPTSGKLSLVDNTPHLFSMLPAQTVEDTTQLDAIWATSSHQDVGIYCFFCGRALISGSCPFHESRHCPISIICCVEKDKMFACSIQFFFWHHLMEMQLPFQKGKLCPLVSWLKVVIFVMIHHVLSYYLLHSWYYFLLTALPIQLSFSES